MPQTVTQEDHRFPCDTCGSDLRYAPGSDLLVCDHCGNSETVSAGNLWGGRSIRELDFLNALENQLPDADIEETRNVQCPNCGASFDYDADVHAAECPFCATPVVSDTGLHRQIKPRGLLPFALTEEHARTAMNDWLGGLWFAPSGLKQFARKGRRMSGIYVPYWTFDAQTDSRYRGERGDVYYETRTVRRDGETREVRVARTDWSPTSGRVSRYFDDVLVLASQSLPRKYTEALEPWDLPALEPYNPEYIAGFRAEAYQVDLREGFDTARIHMDRVILRDVKFDIGGDKQRVHDVKTDISDITFKHILLPVWVAAYKYRGRTFRFVVNGRTGRVKGERPWSAWKITLAVIAALIAAAAVGYLYALNEGAVPIEFNLPSR